MGYPTAELRSCVKVEAAVLSFMLLNVHGGGMTYRPSWAPVLNKPTVSVDGHVKQHLNVPCIELLMTVKCVSTLHSSVSSAAELNSVRHQESAGLPPCRKWP